MDLIRLIVMFILLVLVVAMIGAMVTLLVIPSVVGALGGRTAWVQDVGNGMGTSLALSSPASAGNYLLEGLLGHEGLLWFKVMIGCAGVFLMMLIGYNLLVKVLSAIG